MDIWGKKTLRGANRELNQTVNTKAKRDTSYVSLALLKYEGGVRVLYPVPTRNTNTLDYKNGARKMHKMTPAPLKITNFIYTKQAWENIGAIPEQIGGTFVAIVYFDTDVNVVINQFENTSLLAEKLNPARYTSDSATYNTDKSCLILDIVVVQ